MKQNLFHTLMYDAWKNNSAFRDIMIMVPTFQKTNIFKGHYLKSLALSLSYLCLIFRDAVNPKHKLYHCNGVNERHSESNL